MSKETYIGQTAEVVEVRGYPGKWRVEQTHPGKTTLRRLGDSRLVLELVGDDRGRIIARQVVAKRRRKAA